MLKVSSHKVYDKQYSILYLVDLTAQGSSKGQVLNAYEQEQKHIEAEISERLTGVALMCTALQSYLTDAQEELSEITNYINETNRYVHRTARDVLPRELVEKGLVDTLKDFARKFERRYEIPCRIRDQKEIIGIEDLETAVHLYRVIQEASVTIVENRQTRSLVVEIREEGDQLVLVVKGFGKQLPKGSSQEEKLGLAMVQKRSQLIGAELDINMFEEYATVVRCTVALDSVCL